MRKATRVLVLVCFALLISGCDSVVRPPEVPEVMRALGVPVQRTKSKPNSAPKIRLYFDRSISMRGFAAKEDSRYRQIVRALQDHAATTATEVKQFGFGANPEPLSELERTLAVTPGFYDKTVTDFPHLLIEAAPTPGVVSLVISDLVQSAVGTDARSVASALRDLGHSPPEVLLLAFRSGFEGWYFIESPGATQRRLRIDFDGMSLHSGRPFYVLVLAASPDDLEFCRRNLLVDLPDAEHYLASEPAFEVVDLAPIPEAEIRDNRWNLFRNSAPVDELPRGWAVSLLALGPSQLPPPPLRLALKVESHAPVRFLGDLDWELTSRSLRKGKWEWREPTGIKPRIQLAPKSEPSSKGERRSQSSDEGSQSEKKVIWLELQVTRPPAGGWDAYRLRLKPGTGNLRPPFWVDAWSTNDDSDLSQAHRTLQLDLFVEALIRSIQERVILTDQLILLGRKE